MWVIDFCQVSLFAFLAVLHVASTELSESMPYLVITVANPNYSNVLAQRPFPERLSNGMEFIFLKT
jgi:hypothetical protein